MALAFNETNHYQTIQMTLAFNETNHYQIIKWHKHLMKQIIIK